MNMQTWGTINMPWVAKIEQPVVPLGFTDEKIRFIWCTDLHLDDEGVAPIADLEKAINDCNEWKPHAFIATGDLANNRLDDCRRFYYHTKRCQRPVYTCLGEHDLSEYPPGSYGNPTVDEMSGEAAYNYGPPFYYYKVLTSGDGTFTALCLFLETLYYDDDPTPLDAPGNSAYHSPGDRWGISDITPLGGYYKQIPSEELAWITATLAAVDSDVVLVFIHQSPIEASRIVNLAELADTLQPDPRPIIGFAGHLHGWATTRTLTTTDTLRSFTFYEMVAMMDSYAWCRVTLGFAAGNITVDSLHIYNYTDPGTYLISDPPFTVIP